MIPGYGHVDNLIIIIMMLAIGERLLPFLTSTVGRMIFDHAADGTPSAFPLSADFGFGFGLKEAITRIYSGGSRSYELQSFLPQCLSIPVALQMSMVGYALWLQLLFRWPLVDRTIYYSKFKCLCSVFGIFMVFCFCVPYPLNMQMENKMTALMSVFIFVAFEVGREIYKIFVLKLLYYTIF